jgi:2-polyprenyl-6-methoxyphenol hydroxylase-like FAD-dependent oxidoreductase
MLDVIIIGEGFAGAAAAILLSRAGFHLATVDKHPTCRAEFRAEQIVGHQVHTLDRLGLLQVVVGATRPVDHAGVFANGRLLGRFASSHYGIDYPDMVAALRIAVPTEVERHIGSVTGIETTDHAQTVTLANGTRLQSRLVVLATGLHRKLHIQLGGATKTLSANHSIAVGFDVRLPSGPDDVIVYYGDVTNAVDYLTVFPFKGGLRANLFAYGDPARLREPVASSERLHQLLPKLHAAIGRLEVTGRPCLRINSLSVSAIRRPGVVAIGDAYQTPCPAAGTGIGRLLADVEALCRHAPQWLRQGGAASETEIASYHRDGQRVAANAKAVHDAQYLRARRTGRSIGWRLHRARVQIQMRVIGMV